MRKLMSIMLLASFVFSVGCAMCPDHQSGVADEYQGKGEYQGK